MANFILTTHWTSGEVLPFIRMGACLKQRGHRVTLLTHCHYADRARQAGLGFTAVDTPEEWADFLRENAQIGNPISNLEGVERFRRKYQGPERCLSEYEKVLRHCERADTVLIARHESSTAAFLAAEKLGLPLVSTFVAPSYVTQIAIDEEVFGPSLVADLNTTRASVGLPHAKSWIDWVCSPKRSFGFWPNWFAPADPEWPLRVTPIGFPALDVEDEEVSAKVQALTGSSSRAVLVFGGTGRQLHPGFYTASIEACRRVKRECLVATPHRDLLPTVLPENATWFEHLPFANVMPLVAAVIHHGGIGTTSQALAAGKPQLILPDYYDRPANALYLKQLGVAEYLPPARWRANDVAEALASLFTQEKQERCRECAARMSFGQFADSLWEQLEPMVSNPAFVMPGPGSFRAGPAVAEPLGEMPSSRVEDLRVAVANVTGDKRALLLRWLREKHATSSGSRHDRHAVPGTEEPTSMEREPQ